MSRISPLEVEQASGKTAELYQAVKGKLGMVPNMMKTMGRAPAVLEGYLGLSGALSHGTLNAAVREQIALAVGQANSCDYCVAAHSVIGKHAGLSADAILASRSGKASDAKAAAILKLAGTINSKQGKVTDADVQAARSAGVNDAEIAETVANVALNILTNYFNHVTDPVIDFPKAAAL